MGRRNDILAGRLDQSDYSPAAHEARRRSIAGLAAVLSVRQLPGLELGVGCLFEDIYPDSGVGLGDILRPLFEGVLKSRLSASVENRPRDDRANQIASVFARWAFPSARVEVYGEIGREDHSFDTRDLIAEPDHDMAYTVGLQRVWRRTDGELLVLRGELLNTQISHLERVRPQSPPYVHTFITQGHTQLGQLLGAPGGYGGSATTLTLDWIKPGGRGSLTWRRLAREPIIATTDDRDVVHALTAEWLMFRLRFDLKPEVTAAYNLNRSGGGDALNVRLALTGVAHW